MRIALLCAARRGRLFLEKLNELAPDSDRVIFSFREEPWEPPFLDDIAAAAERSGGRFFEAKQLGANRWTGFWHDTPIDLMLMVGWRYMVPAAVYGRARLGTFVFHDSLLPEYRGFSPTVWAIVNGEDHTGVTVFQCADAVDAGNILDQQRVPIGEDETIGVIVERVTQVYLEMLERNWPALASGTSAQRPQDQVHATYTCKRLPEDAEINWAAPSRATYNLIRATSEPYPGAYTCWSGRRLRIWEARRVKNGRRYVGSIPGRIVEVHPGDGVVVLTGDEPLLLTRVQPESGVMQSAADLLIPGVTLGRCR